ncbi:hypothetical protein BROUX41_006435 [Berkeleyomyces rouxiae]
MAPKTLHAIIGGTHRVQKSRAISCPSPAPGSPAPPPRKRTLSSCTPPSRLPDLGYASAPRSATSEAPPTTVLDAIQAVRSQMFTALDLSSACAHSMSSTQIARVLNFQRSAPPLVSTAHVRTALAAGSARATARQIAELLATRTLRRVVVDRPRRRRWEGLVSVDDLERMVRGGPLDVPRPAAAAAGEARAFLPPPSPSPSRAPTSPVTRDTADAFVGWLRGTAVGGLASAQEDELVRAGFLTAPTAQDWARRGTSASRSLGNAMVESEALALAVPGQGALLRVVDAAVRALVDMVARRPWREVVVADVRSWWDGATPGTENKRRRGERVDKEAAARKWRDFYGLRFEWVLKEAVGEGALEVFETGSVGKAIRALEWDTGRG